MKRDMDSVTFGGSRILYRIERTNRRKTLAITVEPDTTVTVAVPKGTRRTRIAGVVTNKAEWILEQQDRFSRNRVTTRHRLVSGESLLYLGRQYQLKVVSDSRVHVVPQVAMTRGSLRVTVSRRWSASHRREAVHSALVEWYRQHASSYLETVTERYAQKLGIQYVSVRVREMKTRWGSGGPSGHLRFNWRIILAPRRLIEYVVAHELCHVRHRNHSRDFWRLLGRVQPDYERRRMELELTGSRFDFR